MSKNKHRVVAKVRTQDWYSKATKELEDYPDVDWSVEPPRRPGHPKLVLRYKGQERSFPVPSSERTRGNHKYIVGRIRKAVADMKKFSEG